MRGDFIYYYVYDNRCLSTQTRQSKKRPNHLLLEIVLNQSYQIKEREINSIYIKFS